MSKISYVNLHCHSQYSVLDASSNYKDYCDLINDTSDQIKSFAMTEHGHLCGTIDYLNTCKEYNAKPICGMEAYVTTEQEWSDYLEDKKKVPSRGHLVILAKNKQGYKDLVALNNYCIKEHRVYTSKIQRWYVLQTPEILKKFNKGNWIILAACVGSYIFSPYNFKDDLKETAKRYKEIKDIFGDDFYFEFQFLNIESQRKMNKLQMSLMNKFPNQKAVVTCDAHYSRPELGELRDIVMAMNWKISLKRYKMIKDEKSESQEQVNIHFRTNDELYDDWKEFHSDIIPEEELQKACQNTVDIYNSIKTFSLNKTQSLKYMEPYFEEEGKSTDDIIKEKCIAGLKEKVGNHPELKKYVKQLKEELEIVKEKGFASYFLVLLKVIKNLKEKDVMIGAGRGSGGSFLINYLLGVTNVDPVECGFLSERFLDKAREDAPDVDIDVSDRKKMYQIFKDTFPNHDVVLLSNRNTLSVKALMKTIWRTLEIDIPIKNDHLDSADKISKYIDDNYNPTTMKLEHFLNDKNIKGYIEEYNRQNPKIDLVKVLKEFYENLSAISVHAGGVAVIDKKENIVPYVPLIGNLMSHYATGFCESGSFKELEQIGHIKFDMLGLGNLRNLQSTIYSISKAFKTPIEKIYEKIDPKNLDLKIPEVYEGFQSGFTEGIFQFSSAGMTDLLKRLKAESIVELSMANATYRPGPLAGNVDKLIVENKFNEDVEKLFSDKMWVYLGPILDDTFSCMVFEEQIMMIGRDIGDFDPSQLNRFRKFLKEGQKIIVQNKRRYNKLREEFYDQFMEKGKEKDLDPLELEKLWQLMAEFSKYSFNFSHSYCYSIIAYQTMYMSVMFPGYWYASVLNESPEKLANVIEELRERGLNIKFSPPQLGNFHTKYTFIPSEEKNPFDGTIYIGLRHIKGFGEKAMPQMEQLIGQSFESLEDILEYIKVNKLNAINKRTLLAMANIGMFSELGLGREKARAKVLLEKDSKNYRVEIESEEGKRKKWRPMKITEAIEKDKEENNINDKFFFAQEKEAIGVPFVDNPANNLKASIRKLKQSREFANKYLDGGLINSCKKKKTKTGKTYYFITIDSVIQKKQISLFCWSDTIKKVSEEVLDELKKYDTVVFTGTENNWKSSTYNMKELIQIEEKE